MAFKEKQSIARMVNNLNPTINIMKDNGGGGDLSNKYQHLLTSFRSGPSATDHYLCSVVIINDSNTPISNDEIMTILTSATSDNPVPANFSEVKIVDGALQTTLSGIALYGFMSGMKQLYYIMPSGGQGLFNGNFLNFTDTVSKIYDSGKE